MIKVHNAWLVHVNSYRLYFSTKNSLWHESSLTECRDSLNILTIHIDPWPSLGCWCMKVPKTAEIHLCSLLLCSLVLRVLGKHWSLNHKSVLHYSRELLKYLVDLTKLYQQALYEVSVMQDPLSWSRVHGSLASGQPNQPLLYFPCRL